MKVEPVVDPDDTDCYPQTQFVTHRFTKSYAHNCGSKGVNNVIVLMAQPLHIQNNHARAHKLDN
jgi:hypothetical protein